MNRIALHFRRSRWSRIVVLALVAVFVTATDAFACLDTCVSTFGSSFERDSNTWELDSCAERYNSSGGTTTVCYYRVYPT